MFTVTTTDIGKRRPNSEIQIVFTYTDMDITAIAASCGCTEAHDDKDAQAVKVKFVVPQIPKHLVADGITELPFKKWVNVQHVNRTTGIVEEVALYFTGTII